MSATLTIAVALLATSAPISFADPADADPDGHRRELIVQPKTLWRRHTPVYAGMFFPPERERLIFTGSMAPRCRITLRMPGEAERVPAEQRIVMRSDEQDILDRVQLVGAQHRNPAGDVRRIEPEDLPPLKVWFAPQVPERLVFPSDDTCLLYVQVGEPDSQFWQEGFWRVSLRFNGKDLVQGLIPGSPNLIRDPNQQNAPSYIWQLQFHSRPVRDETDRAELLYYEFRHAKLDMDDDDDARATAVDRVETLVTMFPNDGRLLSELAEVYEQLERYDRAIEVLENMEALLSEGDLYPLPALIRSRHMNRAEQQSHVEADIHSRLQRLREQVRSVQ